MDELKKLIEALGRTLEEFRAANDERLTALETEGRADPLLVEKVENINADVSKMLAMKAQLEKLETVVARTAAPGGGGGSSPTEHEKAVEAHRKGFDAFFRTGVEGGLRDLAVQAALTTQSDPDGGFTVPADTEAMIDRVAETTSAMRGLSSLITISTGEHKRLVNQGGSTSGWVGESETRTETDTPTLAQIIINVKEIYSEPATTQTALDDSAIDLEKWLADEVGIEFGEEESQGFIAGEGVAEPQGIIAYTTVANASYAWGKVGYIASGETSVFTDVDKLIDLQHSLKAKYREGSTWLMSDATQAHIRKFKLGDGSMIWSPGLVAGAPNILLGKPVEIDDNMPDISAGVFPIAYANFKRAYLIVDRQGIRVIRDNLTTKGSVKFYTTKRVGGGIIMYEAIKLMKIASS